PPARRAVMAVPFLFRLAAEAASRRGTSGRPVREPALHHFRQLDQKWKSTGTSTHTATGLLLLNAGLKTHFRTASTAASFKPVTPRITLMFFTRPSLPTSTCRVTLPWIWASRANSG